jgi:hypothetical protein
MRMQVLSLTHTPPRISQKIYSVRDNLFKLEERLYEMSMARGKSAAATGTKTRAE